MATPYSFMPVLIFNIMIFISLLGYSLVIILLWELQRLNEQASLRWLWWYMQFLPLEFLGKKLIGNNLATTSKEAVPWAASGVTMSWHLYNPVSSSCIFRRNSAALPFLFHWSVWPYSRRTMVSSCKCEQYLFLVGILGFLNTKWFSYCC